MSETMSKIKEFFGFQETSYDEELAPIPSLGTFKEPVVRNQNLSPFPVSEIKVEEPRIYEDSLSIATYLRENKPVIVNLKHLDADSGKRLIDFVCGTAYAINGHMLKVGENIFLFTPANVNIANPDDKTSLSNQETEKRDAFFEKIAVD
ncbi:cell division protein SepF [bacterium]|jgi:cell division inhibitor SepF|nr:cell division protein SepF [bacterium]